MKNLRASNEVFQLSPCVFCGSRRIRLYTCDDDRGEYVAGRCDRCGAQGPEVRGPIGDDRGITDEMKAEAAELWARREVPPLPAPAQHFTCRCNGPKHGRLSGCSGTGVETTGGLCAFCVAECRPAPALELVAPAKGTNGHNGHHNGQGSVA
jgi:hypothetical protein